MVPLTSAGAGSDSPTYTTPSRRRREPTKEQQDCAVRASTEFRLLWGLRGVWEEHWQEISEYFFPMKEWSFNAFQMRTPGQKRTEYIFDSTAPMALQRGAAIVSSLLTPQDRRWQSVFSPDPVVMQDRLSRLWYEKVTELVFQYRYAPEANFESQNQSTIVSDLAFGTGVLFVDRLSGRRAGPWYKNMNLGQVYLRENHQKVIDSAFRYFQMTAKQIKDMFDPDNAYRGEDVFSPPDMVLEAAEHSPDRLFWLLHVCRPRREHEIERGRKDYKGMNWVSYYVHVDSMSLLSEGGYRTFPYPTTRYYVEDDEVYGRCEAMNVLPDVKTLNEHARAMLKQAHRQTDPVILTHDNSQLANLSMIPGAVNPGGVSADGRPLAHTLPVGNWQVAKDLLEGLRANIKAAFYNDIMDILIKDREEMTATEVLDRRGQKAQLLVPILGRKRSEYLDPMLHRELDILQSLGLLPEPPKLVRESFGDYDTEYMSDLSKNQRANQLAGFQRIFSEAAQMSQMIQKPEIMDVFNTDVALREGADISDVPEHWLLGEDDVAQIRQQRAQAQAEQQSVQAAPGAAALMGAHAKLAAAGAVPAPHAPGGPAPAPAAPGGSLTPIYGPMPGGGRGR